MPGGSLVPRANTTSMSLQLAALAGGAITGLRAAEAAAAIIATARRDVG
jgi:hypothetical protein